MQTRQANEVFLTTKEVLEYLQVNLRTVYRLIKAGKIPAVRVGRQWRFRKRDIDAWLDGQGTGAPVPATATPALQGRTRVLVVDDEASMRDLLVADLKMPGMDGLTLIRQAKRLRSDLSVIIVTGFSSESSAIEALNLGAASYLLKPFGVPDVLSAASKALGVPSAR